MRQRLGDNSTTLELDRREPPNKRPLLRWGGDEGRLPLDSHLVKKPCKVTSGLEQRQRLIPTRDVGLTLVRRR